MSNSLKWRQLQEAGFHAVLVLIGLDLLLQKALFCERHSFSFLFLFFVFPFWVGQLSALIIYSPSAGI